MAFVLIKLANAFNNHIKIVKELNIKITVSAFGDFFCKKFACQPLFVGSA
jgi:hypothetical protein